MKRKTAIIASAAVAVIAAFAVIWKCCFSPTKIAFVNYQVADLGQIAKANTDRFIRIDDLPVEDIAKAKRYDMVFINGMGIRITSGQRDTLVKSAEKGLPVLVTAATNPQNNIVSVDSTAEADLKAYLSAGGRANYRNMLAYVRKNIDRKVTGTSGPEKAAAQTLHMLYHPDPADPENEALGFNSISEYLNFLKINGLYRQDAPEIIITGQMGEPSELIRELEKSGNNVYPVRFARTFFHEGHADSVNVSAVINMAHGRMGDYIVDFLEEKNVPLFAPLNINGLVEDWEKDLMGMNGGFLSQSVVTPEIDGAIRPYVLFGNYIDEDDGLQYLRAIPERLGHFVATVNNYISLQHKPNSEKKIAIYYFKGPGQSALTAGGMDVVPSLSTKRMLMM